MRTGSLLKQRIKDQVDGPPRRCLHGLMIFAQVIDRQGEIDLTLIIDAMGQPIAVLAQPQMVMAKAEGCRSAVLQTKCDR